MAKIDMLKAGVAVGEGILDIGMEKWDAKSGRTAAFKNATDIERLVIVLGGALLQVFTKQDKLGEAMAISATPLFMKSVWSAIETRGAAAGAAAPARTYTPRRAAVPTSRTYQPEFQQAIAV